MNRLSVKRLGIVVLGGLAAVCAMTATAAAAEDTGMLRLYNLGPLEWVAPVFAGASVGIVAWLVLSSMPEEPDVYTHTESACPACGRAVLDDWRLCPHCGTLIEHRTAGDDSDVNVHE